MTKTQRQCEEEGELFAEIIDYDFAMSRVTDAKQASFYFYGIEKVKFRSLDTNGFLKSVILKNKSIVEAKIGNAIKMETAEEHVFLKSMKVPF